MIFATVGTSRFGFERLLRGVDALAVDHEVVVQYGASKFVPDAMLAEAFMPYPVVVERMRAASIVVAHGGVGSILTALHVGHRPIIVPRERQYSEAVDDHQAELGARLAETDLVTVVTEMADLPAAVAKAREGRANGPVNSELADAVREFVDSVLRAS